MKRDYRQQAIALAGLLQATYLVDQVARTGKVDEASFNSSAHSLFTFDPESAEAVYGSVNGVRLGLQVLRELLAGQNRENYRAVVRYALGAIYLQRKLSGEPEMISVLTSRLKHTELKLEHFSQDINEIASSIAAIYQDTISTFKFRIQVSGNVEKLQNPNNADKIRALLLAAIRSAMLWRQLGGSRWKLLFIRRRLLREVDALLTR